MTEIHKNLFVGNETDYEFKVKNQEEWSVVHACKEPYHRQALGYRGRAASKDHPEYLMAKRENRRVGDYLKELHLTEGRATGFPKIYHAIQKNGSPKPHFETDEDRTYFLARLAVHPEMKQRDQAEVK